MHGSLSRDRQVGASGTSVEARCYFAFGISGAPQHLQGITRCENVIAINTDPHAPMMKRADLAIVADAQAVMPALARLLKHLATDTLAMTLNVAILVSAGAHSLSGRPRRADLDARAIELALRLSPSAPLHVVHAGDPKEAALRDYLGAGNRNLDGAGPSERR